MLEFKDVSIFYKNNSIIKDLSFSVSKGEILGIVGLSGSGKSTILKSIFDPLIGSMKINGSIFFKENNLLKMEKEKLREVFGKEIGFVFQNSELSLSPNHTIRQSLLMYVQQHKQIPEETIIEEALKILNMMELDETVLDKYPFELSGGMNQKIGIMMAMILKPDLLLLDEPTSALDVVIQKQIIDELLKIKGETTIVIVSHNMAVIESICDHILVLYDGIAVDYGKKEDVLFHPQHSLTKQLISSIQRRKNVRS